MTSDCQRRLLRREQLAADRVRVLGGGARSRLWAQIRADITGLPVERSAVSDASAVGAALLGAVASGRWRNPAEVARRVGVLAETIEPRPPLRPRYDEAHAFYRKLFQSLKPMFS